MKKIDWDGISTNELDDVSIGECSGHVMSVTHCCFYMRMNHNNKNSDNLVREDREERKFSRTNEDGKKISEEGTMNEPRSNSARRFENAVNNGVELKKHET